MIFWEHTLSHKKPIPPPALSTQAKEYKSYQKLLPITPPHRTFWTIRVIYSPTKILELKYISRQCDNFAQHYPLPCILMGNKVGGMIIGLIINVLQLESESLE